MLGLSAFSVGAAKRVALDVSPQFGDVPVVPLFGVHELAFVVVESGGGQREGVSGVGDVPAGVLVAGIGNRLLSEEGARRVVGILAVDAEEGDALAVVRRRLLEVWELEAAGAAPRGPDVEHYGVTAQGGDPLLISVLPT